MQGLVAAARTLAFRLSETEALGGLMSSSGLSRRWGWAWVLDQGAGGKEAPLGGASASPSVRTFLLQRELCCQQRPTGCDDRTVSVSFPGLKFHNQRPPSLTLVLWSQSGEVTSLLPQVNE